MAQGGHETEIKLAVASAGAAQRLLRTAGFRIFKRRVFEQNIVYDTPASSLCQSGRLLRARRAGRIATLTFKGVPMASKHKSREELEVTVSDAAAMGAILERLGFRVASRYEKYRAEYRRPGSRGIATIDETPIGVYVELEGSPEWIDRTARNLGFQEKDYITSSYSRLYQNWCAARGMPATGMVFD